MLAYSGKGWLEISSLDLDAHVRDNFTLLRASLPAKRRTCVPFADTTAPDAIPMIDVVRSSVAGPACEMTRCSYCGSAAAPPSPGIWPKISGDGRQLTCPTVRTVASLGQDPGLVARTVRAVANRGSDEPG